MSLPTLITSSNLKNVLKNREVFGRSFRLLEAGLNKQTIDQFEKGHITPASYHDLLHCAPEPNERVAVGLAEKNCFQDYLGSMGVNNKHHLIIYDRSPFGLVNSARLWWQLRYFGHENVSVLNGGLVNFVKHLTESGENLSEWMTAGNIQEFEKETYVIKSERKKEMTREFDDVKENVQTKQEQLVDSRKPEELLNGFIPGSINLDFFSLFDHKAGTLKSQEELIEIFKAKNIDLTSNETKPLVSLCHIGMRAATLCLVAHEIAGKDVPLYYGSWLNYSSKK